MQHSKSSTEIYLGELSVYVTGFFQHSLIESIPHRFLNHTSVSLHQYTPRVEANTLRVVFQNPMCNSVVYVIHSHLHLKVDIRLCYEQTIHDFTMVILTSHKEGGCTILEVRNGIAHEVYMQMNQAN